MTIPISVVVPTCHRERLLVRCLAALDAQDWPADAYEVLVVDDGASASTRQTVAHWAAHSRAVVRYVCAGPER